MRILINRISNRISGAEKYTIYLLKSLYACKELNIIFSSDNKLLNNEVKKIGVKVQPISPRLNEIGTKKQLLYSFIFLPIYFYKYFIFFKRSEKFDIIVFESINEKIFLSIFLSIFKKKVIWVEHGPLFHTKRATLIKWLYKLNSKFVSYIICVSNSTQNDLISNGVEKKKTTVIYIGVDINYFKPLPSSKILSIKRKLQCGSKKIIAFLGTITKEKGIIDFLITAELILREKKDIVFLFIGTGDMLSWVKAEVLKRGLSNQFYFTGYVSDVRLYLGIADVLFFPTQHHEGLSISLLEASAMGIPVVGKNIGGNKEVINSSINGFLYNDFSYEEIKTILLKTLSGKKFFAKNARKIAVNNFSISKNSTLFLKFFKKVLYEN